MKTIAPKLMGRFGNQMFIYAHARALAEQQNHRFVCQPWLGQEIFDLNDDPQEGEPDIWVDGYCQNQESLIYTKRDCQRWFRFKYPVATYGTYAHHRAGDYKNLGYVVVHENSYWNAEAVYGVGIDEIITECSGRTWVDDFRILAGAVVLLRGNSSFSWWAGTLGNGSVFSPVIDRKKGGEEHECQFVPGNWPKFANLPNITDLHLNP